MARAQRLLDLLQVLRRHRTPVSGQVLARNLGISIRTLYRDIATLQAQGADIEGEPGLGYVLRPGFLLPPLMLTQEEIEALALGAQWVADRADPHLAHAATDALAKISAVLPEEIRAALNVPALMLGPQMDPVDMSEILRALRRAIRVEHRVILHYRDAKGEATIRPVWPLALAYFESVRVLVAWCELRNDFRHFRTDRIATLDLTHQRYPKRRAALLREWRTQQTIEFATAKI